MATKSSRMFVIPIAPRVRMHHDPRRILPAEGAYVPATVEWMRSVRDGDVKRGAPSAAEPVPKTTKTKRKRKG
jgi:hypothetical protein